MVIKMSDIKKEIDRIRDIVDESFRKAVEELENIKKEVSEWPIPRRLVRLYRELEYIVDSFEETLDDVRKKLREIRKNALNIGDKDALEAVDKLEEFIRSRIREFDKKYREFLGYIEDNYPEIKTRRGARWAAITMLPWRLTRTISEEVSDAIKQALDETRRALEYASTVVSSIRLREEDAKIIDELVEAGVFKSRSEAVAFFTRKGIEASRDWLEKVREHLAKIRELRDHVMRELGKREEDKAG
jgi:Arc/MetJ-type ribon-helix-helix transcriptional regulator